MNSSLDTYLMSIVIEKFEYFHLYKRTAGRDALGCPFLLLTNRRLVTKS